MNRRLLILILLAVATAVAIRLFATGDAENAPVAPSRDRTPERKSRRPPGALGEETAPGPEDDVPHTKDEIDGEGPTFLPLRVEVVHVETGETIPEAVVTLENQDLLPGLSASFSLSAKLPEGLALERERFEVRGTILVREEPPDHRAGVARDEPDRPGDGEGRDPGARRRGEKRPSRIRGPILHGAHDHGDGGDPRPRDPGPSRGRADHRGAGGIESRGGLGPAGSAAACFRYRIGRSSP